MKLLDTRIVTGHTGQPVEIVDVMIDGAILPISMLKSEYDAMSAPVLSSLPTMNREYRMMDDEDGCGTDADLYNWARGG